TTLGLPPDLAALGDSALRDRVRSLGEALSAGTLRVIANDADTEARLATDRAVQTRESAWKVTVWAIALGALVTLAASAWLYRTIAVPLGRARRYAEEVAAGRADAGLPRHTADEIGALTRAVEAMKEALAGRVAVMREMAGVVIFQAEGVGVAARHALGVQEHADANGAGADLEDMHEVVRRAETLRDLAEQMLQA
ncbi:MAG: HAMP domain-containing protein, partial [Actinobacteria bacterium]